MRAILTAGLLLLGAPGAGAADFSAGSEAAEWGLAGEEKARFEARVVDVLCALSGDCPADCGGGTRQMGLLRSADGVLVLAVKNVQPLFTGAATDLAPWCGQEVEVDGLLVGDPGAIPAKLYQVQRIRARGAAEWTPTTAFTRVWRERNPEAPQGEWFRNDPRIRARIEAEGWFGLGLERDAEILRELFP